MHRRSREEISICALEPLEPRLLFSASVGAPPLTEILPDLAETEVSIPPGEGDGQLALSEPVMAATDLNLTGALDVLVEPGLQAAIQPALDVYVADLQDEGYSVTVQEFTGLAADLRAHLQSRYVSAGIEGALLVGDLPTMTFTNDNDFEGNTVSFIHDLYFMDMDGTYVLGEGGEPDEHLDGTGDVGPEIYVSRLTPSGVTGLTGQSEAELITDYLARNHAYRTGQLTYADRSVLWTDDDWDHWGEPRLGDLYDEHLVINDPAETTRESYLDTLALDYESMLELIHSGTTYHAVTGTGGGTVSAGDIRDVNPRIGFYNLWNCSAGRFTVTNNLISTYVYAGDFGLNAVGSTKTGSMYYTYRFYDDQAAGMSVGQALANTLDVYARETDVGGIDAEWVRWFYGLTMQGDPTLRPAVMGESASSVEIVSPTVSDVWMLDETNLLLLEASVTEESFMGDVDVTWSMSAGPDGASVAFENPSATATPARFSQPGEYVLRITATDGMQTAWDEVSVAIRETWQTPPDNAAPLVYAGNNVREPSNELTLDGSAIDDGNPADPGTVHYRWQLVDGPGQAYFQDVSDPTSAVNVDAFGRYTFRLSADDGQVVTAHDVSVILAIPGDTDFDADMDYDDAWTILAAYGVPGEYTWEEGDFSGDGAVDGDDYLLFKPWMWTEFSDMLDSAGPQDPTPLTLLGEAPSSGAVLEDGNAAARALPKPELLAAAWLNAPAPGPAALPAAEPFLPARKAESLLMSLPGVAPVDTAAPTGTVEGSAWGTATQPQQPTPTARLDALEDVLELTALKWTRTH